MNKECERARDPNRSAYRAAPDLPRFIVAMKFFPALRHTTARGVSVRSEMFGLRVSGGVAKRRSQV